MAAALDRRFIDNDEQLTRATGMSAREIQRAQGQQALHRAERSALADALASPEPTVIAAAASVVDDEASMTLLEGHARVAWLDAPATMLADRVGGDDRQRPAGTTSATLAAQHAARAAALQRAADIIVRTDVTVHEAVATLLAWAENGAR